MGAGSRVPVIRLQLKPAEGAVSSTVAKPKRQAEHSSSENGPIEALTSDEIPQVGGGMIGAIAGAVAGPVISNV